MGLGDLIENVVEAFTGHNNDNEAANNANNGNVLPASQDPMGDPADAQSGVLPASQDPQGDPADARAGILPASADPLGDPADHR